ncbi:sensor histidine kinase [Cyclobacterium qasimii]|uniref:histidine kinase n=2 Tax=Cyclobacterium qasimii TaxID=1350429 RepID=S7WP88_9BACT|nr:HAMP domain-containing sensor histidine kinase [Cyclobacterium qasimii]EPR65968.1 two-component sensor histidine kinase [Cyclobacterium qasimii M12-11B]GEO23132.1 two-component sensor histidine kinase [Cyclobacterium qasimii]
MKLLNQSLKYLSISILGIVTIWAVLFYMNMLNEIKSSIDEGLENYKRLIIRNAQLDSTILTKTYFDESFFTIQKIDREKALGIKDRFIDSEIYMQDADDKEPEPEPVRMLLTAFESNGHYYELKVANSMVEEDDLIDELFWDVVWLYIVLIAGIVLVNNIVLRKLWEPFYDFLNQLKNFRLGSTQLLPKTNSQTKEFSDLEQAVNTLLAHSIATFEQQKEFIGNASHELQTPLAVVTNKLELLLESEDLKEVHAEKIAEVFQIIERLVRLNRSLLLLSKIDNKQFFDNQQVSMNEIVQQFKNELEEIALFKGLTITVTETEKLEVNLDPTLANIIVVNLLKNAIFHNTKKGVVAISLTKDSLQISNTGSSEPLDQAKLFNRFHKSETQGNGTGLGLSIVKAITDLYGYTISYHFDNGSHTFEVKFNSL